MLISVIMLTHNRKGLVLRALAALGEQTLPKPDYEVILVADSCTDGTVEAVSALFPIFPVNLRLTEVAVRNIAKARNAGARLARGKYIAFTDDDCFADPHWLVGLLEKLTEPGTVGVGGKTVTIAKERTPLTHQVENADQMDLLPTCNAAFRREAFEALGGFNENFGALNEDTDLCWRLRSFGSLAYAPQALVVHPPRPESFRAKVRILRLFETEFTLAARNPALYRQYRRSPWYFIYWRFLVKDSLGHCKAAFGDCLKRRRPDHALIRCALIAARAGYLLYLIPGFRLAAAKASSAAK